MASQLAALYTQSRKQEILKATHDLVSSLQSRATYLLTLNNMVETNRHPAKAALYMTQIIGQADEELRKLVELRELLHGGTIHVTA